MTQSLRIRVDGSDRRPFKYCATFLWSEAGAPVAPLPPADLYAEGDLAAYLEDCGASLEDVSALLDSLNETASAEIAVIPPTELLEVLWSHPGKPPPSH